MNKKQNRDYEAELAALVKADFAQRQAGRRSLEAQWQLNANFLMGNQYCAMTGSGEVADIYRDYYWQQREVYNHIAPIVEARISKLNSVRPKLSVRPSSSDGNDIKTAATAGKILNSACNKLELDAVLLKGAQWSEVTGSVFYKLSWDVKAGRLVGIKDGERIFEGDVRVDVCSPYEIYPDSLSASDISECGSIIHAKAMPVDEIEMVYGKAVMPEDITTMGLDNAVGGGVAPRLSRFSKKDYAVVIERYAAPTAQKPDGELIVVASNTLLHYGPLPFRCGEDNSYALPFIKQDSLIQPGCFYGVSVIERCIPVQRAFNAVKNRKHEFMNRIAMGVLAVEDGSVDTDNLETEGLNPGKILVYRQGSTIPKLLDAGSIPADFNAEEDKLIEEFVSVSGVSGIMRSSDVPSSITSGVGLQLLLDQDDSRMAATIQRVKNAAKTMGKFILRLYKQFARAPRLVRFAGEEGEIELISWKSSSLTSDDVVLDAENEPGDSLASRRAMVFEILKSGLLHDENGKLSDSMRFKVLETLGYGSWEMMRSNQKLHILQASRENSAVESCAPRVRVIDDHRLHIDEHTNFMLSNEFIKLCLVNPELEEVLTTHILEHKAALKTDAEVENGGIGGKSVNNQNTETVCAVDPNSLESSPQPVGFVCGGAEERLPMNKPSNTETAENYGKIEEKGESDAIR